MSCETTRLRLRSLARCGAVLALVVSCGAGDAPRSTGPQGPAGSNAAGSNATGSNATGANAAGANAEGPAARQFAAWLAAFNAADRARLQAYHQQSFPYEAAGQALGDIDHELGLREGTGGLELKKVEESTPTRFVGVLKERDSDQHARASMEVDAAAPHAVRAFKLAGIPTPAELRPPRMTEADALRALRAEIEKAVAADRFAGAVLVAKNGAPIFSEAYGMADREKKIPNTLETRFRVGSMNKMFTAVATILLVQSGRLALEDPIGKHLRDYPNKNVASKVTIHHLLTHTGGTGDIFGPEFDKQRLALRTHADYVKLYGARELRFEPGSKWEYSNYGFLLLGAVIERAARQNYYDWVGNRVFAVAGMTSTASPLEGRAEPGRSVPYTRKSPGAPWTTAAGTLPVRGTAAGGGDSTVTDLLRFASALTSHQFVDPALTAQLTTGKVATPGGGKYAYGFIDTTTDGVRCFGHGGGAPGMNGQLLICDSGYAIAILANVDPPAADRLATFLQNRLPAK